MDTNKFNGTNYNDWLRNLRIILDFENQGYVMDSSLPTALPKGSSPEERVTFKKKLEDNSKVRTIILASMTNEIQNQYDRLDDVPSIMLRMKEVYAIADRYIRYATTKAFVGTKMIEGSSVQRHGVKMLSVVEKLEDLKAGLDNDMRGFDLQGEKQEDRTLEEEEGQGKASQLLLALRAPLLLLLLRERANEGWRFSAVEGLERSRRLSKDEMILRLRDGKTVVVEVMGSLSFVISDHIWIELKYCYYVPSHISKDRIRRLVDTKSLEIDNLDHLPTCESCLKGKMTKKPFVGQSTLANGLLNLIHTDVCGPLNIPTRGGYSYFITFTDDNSRYRYVYLIRTPPGMPQLNGVAERRNQTLLDMVRSMMSFTELFPSFWVMHLRWLPSCLTWRHLRWYPDAIRDMACVLEKGFPADSQRDEVLLEESSETLLQNDATSFEPSVPTDGVAVLRRSTRESRPPERYGFVQLTSQLYNDPRTYGEAMSDIDSDKWLEAMKSKMDSMGSNQVWSLVYPPKGVRSIGCKWVYKYKLGADREVTAFKTRLVAKGYTQQPGVDFDETYSPVAMAKSIRILLAIAAWYEYEIWQINVITAFLNSFIEEEIFMDQPEGFTSVREEQKVYRLQRSIYGLKQYSRSWNMCFDEVIRGYDFIKNEHDPCVYKKISGSSVAYLVLYVDDILLIGNDVKMLGCIKAWLSMQFSMKDISEASYILGIKIYRDRSRRMLELTQSSYIKKVLKRFKMKNIKRGFLPMRHGIKLSKKQSPKTDEELKRMSDIPYASASDDDDVKSQSGFIFKLNGGAVAWKSSKQATTTDSTTEAEYIAASEAAKEVV
ncbi:UNVERIFIED_CONTAM: Retrovirus-related Pol polyprotein from transposon TNT 1-94 [Sesamum latifolium]|uniref:Retrovirus-related Pol polyprotein from transposon TNT 1-94 n=1 Tax=Sesamum latifolium TaxID=2727402 RepID=A0AAW2SSR3_9LAMI